MTSFSLLVLNRASTSTYAYERSKFVVLSPDFDSQQATFMATMMNLFVELLAEIRGHIKLLSSHVIFSQSCRFARNAYGEANGKIWCSICIQCGIRRSNMHHDTNWLSMASAVVNLARLCKACAKHFEAERFHMVDGCYLHLIP
jgi:hypothetical protein